ncbi:MAG: hypothetical protein ACLFQ1_11740 [Halochromatium sp.]|uniref:hypothetical protein n=1 Tax=Halochromatium sp. TaxID=2049430 RepID=UPI00397C05AF
MMRLDDTLARHIAERDTDAAEALLGPTNAPEPPPPATDWTDLAEPPPRAALIQDGQQLAQGLHRLSRLLADGDWSRIRLHREQWATVTAESAAALREFGA